MGREILDCTNRKKGNLCGKEECGSCFSRSLASCENAKYLAEGQRSPMLIARSSAEKFSFECPKCGHSFEARAYTVSGGSFCPFCSSRQLCDSECKTCFEKSFASSDKAKFWSSEKNRQSPRKVFASSGKKFWFKCGTCEHSFEIGLNMVSKGKFCPFCSSRRLCGDSECKTCFEKSFASRSNAKFYNFEKNKKKSKRSLCEFSRKILV